MRTCLGTCCELVFLLRVLIVRLRPVELQLLSVPPAGEGVDQLGEFYSRFEKVKEFHRKNQNINARQFLSEIDEMVQSDGLQTTEVEGEFGETEIVVVDRE